MREVAGGRLVAGGGGGSFQSGCWKGNCLKIKLKETPVDGGSGGVGGGDALCPRGSDKLRSGIGRGVVCVDGDGDVRQWTWPWTGLAGKLLTGTQAIKFNISLKRTLRIRSVCPHLCARERERQREGGSWRWQRNENRNLRVVVFITRSVNWSTLKSDFVLLAQPQHPSPSPSRSPCLTGLKLSRLFGVCCPVRFPVRSRFGSLCWAC